VSIDISLGAGNQNYKSADLLQRTYPLLEPSRLLLLPERNLNIRSQPPTAVLDVPPLHRGISAPLKPSHSLHSKLQRVQAHHVKEYLRNITKSKAQLYREDKVSYYAIE
jgi:hypothetical protein